MAILNSSKMGYVLDHEKAVRDTFAHCPVQARCLPGLTDFFANGDFCLLPAILDKQNSAVIPDYSNLTADSRNSLVSVAFRYKPDMFNLKGPFMMDSEFDAIQRRKVSVMPIERQPRISSKIEPFPSSCKTGVLDTERSSGSPSTTCATGFQKSLPDFLSASCKSGLRKRKRKTQDICADKTTEAQDVERKFGAVLADGKLLTEFVKDDLVVDNNLSYRSVSKLATSLNLCMKQCTLFSNDSADTAIHTYDSEMYLIPAKSRYCCSLFKDFSCILEGTKYDLVVLDPPWNNKSAKRLRSYDYMDEGELMNIPINDMMNSGGLVALWVTNNDRLKHFTESCLFPGWNITKLAEWTWVKVTRSGMPVSPFSSLHKKPWERLFIGRFGSAATDRISNITDKIIISVPSAVHSSKPPLGEVLKQFLPKNANCLELFARSLTAGWTSWGLEVLKLQNLRLFQMDIYNQ